MRHERYTSDWAPVLFDVLFIAAVLALLGSSRPFCVVATATVAAAAYFAVTGQARRMGALGLALVMAFVWAAVVNTRYAYAHPTPVFLGVNLYAFLAWALSLLGVYVLHDDLANWLRIRGFVVRLLTFMVLWALIGVSCEYFAYHVHGICNLPTGDCEALPLVDCVHAPLWMQIGYVLLGPSYMLLAHRLERGVLPRASTRGRASSEHGLEAVAVQPATPEALRRR